MLNALIQVSRRFHLEVQTTIIIITKPLLGIDYLCRRLAPELSLYYVAQPIIERWVKYHRGPLALLKTSKRTITRHLKAFIRRYL